MMWFIDGFDYLTIANMGLKWDNSPSSYSLVTGAYGKGKAIVPSSGASLTKTLSQNFTSTANSAFHVFVSTLAADVIHVWQDTGSNQCDLRMDATGALFFTRNGTQVGSKSTYRLVPGSEYWLEAQVAISSTVGQANLYVGPTQVLAQTGLNTQTTANSYFNQVVIFGNNLGTTGVTNIDNYHFWDATAGDVTSYPYGEHIIDTELADAVGTNSQWNKGGTTINANNYQQVNEANEDGDTTYVWMAASGAGDIDSYQFTDLQESTMPVGGIGTVAVNTIDRIDDAGPHSFQNYILSSGNSAVSSSISPNSSYINHQRFFGTDPNTSPGWTIAGI